MALVTLSETATQRMFKVVTLTDIVVEVDNPINDFIEAPLKEEHPQQRYLRSVKETLVTVVRHYLRGNFVLLQDF